MARQPWIKLTQVLCAVCLLGSLLAGCETISSGTIQPSAEASVLAPASVTALPDAATTVPAPTPKPALQITGIETISDPEVLMENDDDPYSLLDPEFIDLKQINREQYNALYYAVDHLEPSLDTSSFKLSRIMMYNLVGSLDVGFRVFFLKDFKVSKNRKKVTFTYSGTPEEIQRDTETFHARLGHLIHDVASDGHTDLQKLIGLYDAVCRMSNYTANIQDVNTWSPYSIVNHGEGICTGYARLMKYLLTQSGVQADYVSNEPHAWNIVKINGNWYHSDTTWGAGNSGDTMNNLRTLLMDDQTRVQSMKDNGTISDGIHVGMVSIDAKAPPACADASFNAYTKVGWDYALDIEGGKVYFNGEDGLQSMNLDCTDQKTFLKGVNAYMLCYFYGNLYYVNAFDNFLYQAGPDGQPKLLDGSAPVSRLELQNTKLVYDQTKGDNSVTQSIELLPQAVVLDSAMNQQTFPAATVPRSKSFCWNIHFSRPVDAKADWTGLVCLMDAQKNALPLTYHLSEDGMVLTVRPKACLADAGAVTLLVDSKVSSTTGEPLASPCRMDVQIRSQLQP